MSKGKSNHRKTNTPMQLSIRKLREIADHVAITEVWNPHAKVRQDLFGFGDLLAIGENVGTLIVQATMRSEMKKRVAKITQPDPHDKFSPARVSAARCWLERHNFIEVWGWYKVGRRWRLEVEDITLAHFTSESVSASE
jgi:hypothetical protein